MTGATPYFAVAFVGGLFIVVGMVSSTLCYTSHKIDRSNSLESLSLRTVAGPVANKNKDNPKSCFGLFFPAY